MDTTILNCKIQNQDIEDLTNGKTIEHSFRKSVPVEIKIGDSVVKTWVSVEIVLEPQN